MKLFIALTLPLAAAACAESKEPDPTPAQDGGVPYNQVDPVGTPLAPGNDTTFIGQWRSETVDGQPGLLFGPSGGETLAALYCDERRGLVIERRGLVPTGEIDMMSLSAGTERQSLAVAPVQGQQGPVLRAALPYNADLLAALQQPTPITMDVGEGQSLTLPASPLVPQLINECRGEGA